MLLNKTKQAAAILALSTLSLCFWPQMGLCAAQQAGPDWSQGAVEVAVLEGHKQGIVSAVFSSDGKYLTLGNRDFHANIWDVSSGKSLALMEGFNQWPGCVAFSPDNQFLAAGDYGKVRIWKVPSGDAFSVIEEAGALFAFNPDGKLLATTYKPFREKSQLKLWAFPSGELESAAETAHEKIIKQLTWSPDGSMLASSGDDGTLKLWGGKSCDLIRTIKIEGKPGVFSFSPDGQYLAAIVGEDPGSFLKSAVVMVWDVETGALATKIEGFENGLEPIAFTPDGKHLATGERSQSGAKASLWEVSSGKLVRTYEGHKHWVSKLAFSPDGRFLATGSADGFTLWNTETGEKLQTVTAHTQGLTSLVFSPDGACLATTSMDNTAKLWRIKE